MYISYFIKNFFNKEISNNYYISLMFSYQNNLVVRGRELPSFPLWTIYSGQSYLVALPSKLSNDDIKTLKSK